MVKSYYTKGGWNGLSAKGKGNAILIFILFLIISFFAFKYFYYHKLDFDFNLMNNLLSYTVAILSAWLITWIAIAFLDKDTYVKREYFCADCGNYLGTSPSSCSRCGSNRYTEEDSGVGRTIRNR